MGGNRKLGKYKRDINAEGAENAEVAEGKGGGNH
jgi:hypothetical protein